MTFWSRLLELLGPGYDNRPGAESVRRAFESTYPELEATSVWLRAREVDRDVVAVLYRERKAEMPRVGMPPYKLFSVRADLTSEELPFDHASSPYALRGIK
jgi:hypothetical protein